VIGLFFAWATGEAIIFYRWGKLGAPPTPGVLALSSGLYVGLAVIGEYRPARPVVTAFAWAVNAAILMQVLGKAPTGTTGWPPALIDDPSVIMPPGAAAAAASSAASSAAAGSGAPVVNPGTQLAG
jgi:hypothetical protein